MSCFVGNQSWLLTVGKGDILFTSALKMCYIGQMRRKPFFFVHFVLQVESKKFIRIPLSKPPANITPRMHKHA